MKQQIQRKLANSYLYSGWLPVSILIFCSFFSASDRSTERQNLSVGVCEVDGKLTYRRYNNIGSARTVASLTNHPKYPNNPDVVLTVSSFEAPSNVGDNYGASISGYICAPISGDYTFWIAGDDNVSLNLSTDYNPANARRIAYHNDWTLPRIWDKFETQKSIPITLEAGVVYYIEALMKEAAGGDHFSVGWQLPDGTLQRPIPSTHLSTVIECPAAGIPCNDGNPNTINDATDGTCGCVGISICLPVGTPCDDGSPLTENDQENGHCDCIGKVISKEGLSLIALGKIYQLDELKTPYYLFFAGSDMGGSTSVRSVDKSNLDWKTQGYFQRNRDLGQVFNIPENETIKIDAIVMRTGNSSSAIRTGTPRAAVFLQLFEVKGEPSINDNGTPRGTDATHGFTTNHRADDFLEGVTYESILLATGGFFPDIPPTTQNGGEIGHLHYIRWDLLDENEIVLEGGKRYAFMLGFVEPSAQRGFTMGNNNRASDSSAPALRKDLNGQFWWSIRREGDGTLPPTQIPNAAPPTDSAMLAQLWKESLFAPAYQYDLSPTTDGFPDVDTYRVHEFYIETKPVVVQTKSWEQEISELSVYPNPASDWVEISLFNTGWAKDIELLLTNTQGEILYREKRKALPQQNIYKIDVRTWKHSGTLGIVLKTEEQILIRKLIIK